MDFSPDGKFIAYDVQRRRDSPNRDIYLLSADGSRESLGVDHPSNDRSPVWTPDGQSILFLSNRTGKTGYWTVSVDQGKPRGAPRLVKADTPLAAAIPPSEQESLSSSGAARDSPRTSEAEPRST